MNCPSQRRRSIGVPLSASVATRRGRRWLRVTGERLTDAGGRALALRGCVQDISELRPGEPCGHRLSEAGAADRRRADGR